MRRTWRTLAVHRTRSRSMSAPEYRRLDDAIEARRAGGLEDGGDVGEDLARLSGDVAVDERAGRGVERDLTGAEEERPGPDGLASRALWLSGPDRSRLPPARLAELGGLDDLARPQAARADAHAAHSAVHHGLHGLQVGLEPARPARCGRADGAAHHGALVANFAALGHDVPSLSCAGPCPRDKRLIIANQGMMSDPGPPARASFAGCSPEGFENPARQLDEARPGIPGERPHPCARLLPARRTLSRRRARAACALRSCAVTSSYAFAELRRPDPAPAADCGKLLVDHAARCALQRSRRRLDAPSATSLSTSGLSGSRWLPSDDRLEQEEEPRLAIRQLRERWRQQQHVLLVLSPRDGRWVLSRRGEIPAIRRTADLDEPLRCAQQTAQIACPSAGQCAWRDASLQRGQRMSKP